MAKHKKIVKELKRPDQFVDFWTRASHVVVQVVAPRRKPAIAAAVALVVVLVGAAIFNYWDESKRLTDSAALHRIQEMANAELSTTGSEGKVEGKNDDKSDEKPGSGDAVPRFKTEAERQGAVLRELDAFLASHGSSGLKAEAEIMKGAALLDLGRYDDAVAAYSLALSSRLDQRLRFLAHEGQGYAYEGKGDLDKALGAFSQISGDAAEFEGFYQDRALFHRARLTEQKGDRRGAVAIYRQILAKTPETSMKDEVTDRLATIEAK